MTFGEMLRGRREEKGLSRESLSQASGIPFGTIHNYEIGRRSPSFTNVVKLAAALGMDCRAFSGCSDVAEEPEPEKPAPKKKPKKK